MYVLGMNASSVWKEIISRYIGVNIIPNRFHKNIQIGNWAKLMV